MRPSSDRQYRHSTAEDRPSTVRLVTVPEAAEILGVTPDAVRSRLRRGKMRKARGEDGTVLVEMEVETSDGHDGRHEYSDRQLTADLVEVLQDQIEHLRQQLDEAHRANAEHRRLLAAALERIPEIEPPQETSGEPRDGHVTLKETSDNGQERGKAEEPEQRSSWLYRFFFGPS
jgi:hypothetical protein